MDTNAASRYLRGRDRSIRDRIDAEIPVGLATCTVVEAELRYGIAKIGGGARQTFNLDKLLAALTILPFDSAAAKEYALLRTHLERAGALIGPNDLMIASICLAEGLILVTHNVAEFSRVPNLEIEDWEV